MEGFGRVALLNDIRAVVVVVKTLVALVVAVMNVEARKKGETKVE